MTIKDNGKATQESVICPRCSDGRVFAAGIPELAARTGLSETFYMTALAKVRWSVAAA